MVVLRFLSHGVYCLYSSPFPPSLRPQPALAAAADALSARVNSDMLLLL
jgi:hypothetical protein